MNPDRGKHLGQAQQAFVAVDIHQQEGCLRPGQCQTQQALPTILQLLLGPVEVTTAQYGWMSAAQSSSTMYWAGTEQHCLQQYNACTWV